MFGCELAIVESNPLKKLQYRSVGVIHAGMRLRFNYMKKLLARLNLPDRAQVLNAGSGRGEQSYYFARKYPQWSITGIDIDPELVKISRNVAERLRMNNLRFLEADLTHYESPETFDLIFCVDVMEHIEQETQVFQNFYRSLKPGGTLVIHVPGQRRQSRIRFNEQIKKVRRHMNEVEHGHVRGGYQNLDLAQKLEAVGLRVESVNNPAGYWAQAACDLYDLASSHTAATLLAYPIVSGLIMLDSLDNNEKPYPHGAGVLAVAKKSV